MSLTRPRPPGRGRFSPRHLSGGSSQAKIAKQLEVSQSNVSQLERGDDVKLSTLDSYVKALGGHLKISAVFEDETIPIS
jgi:transcriptional regulator with XRE-family HTH domain